MKNPLTIFKRRPIQPVTIHDVDAAMVPDSAKEAKIIRWQTRLRNNVADIAITAVKIREELATAALAERRSRK